MNVYQISFQKHQLLALHKALYQIKFKYLDYDALELAQSPFISDLLVEVRKGLNKFDQSISINFDSFEEMADNNKNTILNGVKFHLSNIPKNTWQNFDYDTKYKIIDNLIAPVKCLEKTVQSLIEYRETLNT